jgi:cell division septal protein FtsQ
MYIDLSLLEKSTIPVWLEDKKEFSQRKMDLEYNKDTVKNIYQYLEKLPWIKNIGCVKFIFPASFILEFTHRTPVLAVKQINNMYTLVDNEGIVLSYACKSIPSSCKEILGVRSTPAAQGEKWDSLEIIAALELVNVVNRNRILDEANISMIDVSNINGRIDPRRSDLVLWTRDKREILWGRAESQKSFGEPSIRDKIENLAKVLQKFPQLEGVKLVKLYIKNSPIITEDKKLGYAARKPK